MVSFSMCFSYVSWLFSFHSSFGPRLILLNQLNLYTKYEVIIHLKRDGQSAIQCFKNQLCCQKCFLFSLKTLLFSFKTISMMNLDLTRSAEYLDLLQGSEYLRFATRTKGVYPMVQPGLNPFIWLCSPWRSLSPSYNTLVKKRKKKRQRRKKKKEKGERLATVYPPLPSRFTSRQNNRLYTT